MRWFSMSTQTFHDPKVEQLGERHGPAGLAVWTSLMCHAGALESQERSGLVQLSFRKLAHECFTDIETAEAIIELTVELGLCHDFEKGLRDFKLVLTSWKRHQATGRKARQRAREAEEEKPLQSANVTDRHAESRDVTTDRQTDRQTDRLLGGSNDDLISQTLDKVSFARTLSSPKPLVVAKTNADFPELDHQAEAAKFEHYWTEGPGAKRDLTDVAWAWRQWLGRATPAEASLTKAPKKGNLYDAKVREIAV